MMIIEYQSRTKISIKFTLEIDGKEVVAKSKIVG